MPKAVKTTVRNYYKYQYSPWAQPTLTGNGQLGGSDFAVWTVGTYRPAYYMFDNNSSTNAELLTSINNNLIFYNPIPLNVTQIYMLHYNGEGKNWSIKNYTLYGSNDNSTWEPIQTETLANTLEQTITISGNTNYYKYHKLYMASAYYDYYSYYMSTTIQMNITATQRLTTAGTSNNYDVYADIDVYKLPMQVERFYYKYQYTNWTHPVPTSNGVIGTGEFACFRSTIYRASNEAYHAFQNNTSDYWGTWSDKYPPQHVGFWNKNPVNITSMSWNQNMASYYVNKYSIQASNDTTDGSDGTWTNLYTYSGTTGATISCSFANTEYYNSYRIVLQGWGKSGLGCGVGNLQMPNAKQKTVTTGTASNYDYYEDKNIYKAINQ